ncbi:MAG TPA: rhodanese-like domain-containing protein [Verrucomicrobiae bacterium]|jgi:rhodanese-related sulfurtransferase|nr:rhodanese-like domain-containing protein [Verrucomicrobiae bacterium]
MSLNVTPKVRTMSKEELIRQIQSGSQIQVLNVLPPQYYNLGFIEGSLKIPVDELDKRDRELDKKKQVVTYCASRECDASRRAAEKLAAKGFDVYAYEGGIKEWKECGYPVELPSAA